MHRRGFEAVFLDFGGTLFSYRTMERPTVLLLERAAARLGLELATDEVIRVWRAASQQVWLEYMHRPFYLHRDLFREMYRRFTRALGSTASAEFLDWFHEEQLGLAVEYLELREGCLETLRDLREAGLHVGIVSNIDEDFLQPMLERGGLEKEVQSRTSSEEARSCKPDPGIFQCALSKAGVEPETVLFVGDSPEADVLGGQRAGMTTVLIHEDDFPPPGAGVGPSAKPDHIIQALPELLPIVAGPQS
jgi:HAD superfamily hydrolase (TIGR01509 family)